MRRPHRIIAATLLVGLGTAAAEAQPVAGPYVSIGAGYNILQDVPAFFPANTINVLPSLRTYRWTDGFQGQASVGWGLGNGLRAELEATNLSNTVNNRVRSGLPTRTTGNVDSYGPMVNLVYDIDLERWFGIASPFTPYVGVGAGYLWSHLSPLTSVTTGAPSIGDVSRVGGTQGAFAYQGIVGAAYAITAVPGLAATAEYRFVGTDDETQGSFAVEQFVRDGLRTGRAYLGDQFNHSFMLGLRYAFDTAPPPPPPPPPAPVVPAAPPAEARTYLVFFDWDRSDLTPRAREIVAQAAQASTHVQTTRIEVNGYTDTSSIHGGARGARYNQGLSVRRAQSVKAELIRDGVPGSVIDIHGYGETHPLVPTGPNQREPQNRRVEIILH